VIAADDFDGFHRDALAARLGSAAGRAAAHDVRDAPALAFVLDDGRAWRFLPGGERIRVERATTRRSPPSWTRPPGAIS
jgi:hypothetical protein